MKIEYGTMDEIRGIIDKIGSLDRYSIEILKQACAELFSGFRMTKIDS